MRSGGVRKFSGRCPIGRDFGRMTCEFVAKYAFLLENRRFLPDCHISARRGPISIAFSEQGGLVKNVSE